MGVPLQREWDPDTAARVDQSLLRQNGVLMQENSQLEAMLGSAREEVTGQGEGARGVPSRAHLRLLCPTPIQGYSPPARFCTSDTR